MTTLLSAPLLALFALPALLLGALAFVLWRRAGERAILFDELARRLDQTKAELKDTTDRLDRANEKNATLRDQMHRVERAVDEARAKTNDLIRQTETRENEWRETRDKQARLTETLTKQVETLTAQLAESGTREREAESRSANARAERDHRAEAARDELQSKLKETHARVSELANKLARAEDRAEELRKRAAEANPEELKQARHKAAQYARMYESMKGLRDMAEERNVNWEVALRHLATWILDHTQPKRAARPDQTLGQIVGEALERVGARLVDAREDHEPAHDDDQRPHEEPTPHAP